MELSAKYTTTEIAAMDSNPPPPPGPTIDVRAFWSAVGLRATGSTVVTARSDAGAAGFLGLSATHLCADPPLMLVSIDQRTSALPVVIAARHFALNFLPREARAIADMFGGKSAQKGAERFEPGKWGRLKTGAPILLSAVGAIDCRLEETIERHGVVIAIGRVVDVLAGAGADPLVHFRGGFWP
jgi:flavin reductase (DIM6/NTAB) family NADH-FMN oxidoreductase RutF